MKAEGPGLSGHVATLLRQARGPAGYSQVQFAEAADVSRPTINKAEQGETIPTMDVCLKLARTLRISEAVMVRALVKDLVGAADPEAVPRIEAELGGAAFWSEIAERHGLRIQHGRTIGTVDPSGRHLTVTRSWTGCYATRVLREIAFRDRIVGETLPSLTIKEDPKNGRYDQHVTTQGEWRIHHLKFHKPWTPDDEPFRFEFVTTIQDAYVLAVDDYARRRTMDDLLPADLRGFLRTYVHHPFERLDLCIELPATYVPEWLDPLCHWDTRPLDDIEEHRNLTAGNICRSAKFEHTNNSAQLTLERPFPGFTFGIEWTPVTGWKPSAGDTQ